MSEFCLWIECRCAEGQAKPKLYTSAVIIAEVNHGTGITMGGLVPDQNR